MAAIIAFIMSLILSVAKAIVWLFSGSSTVLASLADSIQDCFLSATNFLAVKYAMKEADEDHRYGHGKMEGIAALGQAAFIAGSGVFIMLEAVRRFGSGDGIKYPFITIGVIVGAILMNAILVWYQNMVVRRTKSLAIEADRAHYSGDIGVHMGVIIAVLADYLLGWAWVDPILTVGITLWLFRLAYHIGRKAVDMLMDRELPDEERDQIKTIIRRTKGVISSHDLRTHYHGQVIQMSFDIEVDPGLSFIEAHNIAKRVEDRLHKEYPK